MYRNLLYVSILIAWLFACASALARSAHYAGKTYTPESFTRALWCTCGVPGNSMCQDIRNQWGLPPDSVSGTPHFYVAPPTRRQNNDAWKNAAAYAKYQEWGRAQVSMKAAPVSSDGFRWEQQVKSVPYRVKVGCSRNGVCIFETRYRDEVTLVRVPIVAEVSKPEVRALKNKSPESTQLVGTPPEVVSKMIAWLNPSEGERFYDLGCGDGRMMIEAAKYGCLVFGVEINPETASLARGNLWNAGFYGRVDVADATEYDATDADCVALYLYGPQLEAIVSGLSPGTRVASYGHELPGLDNERHSVGEHEFFTAVIPESPFSDMPENGEVPGVERKTSWLGWE